MSDIEKIDKNFSAVSVSPEDDVIWYNIKNSPFKIYGLFNPCEEGGFKRLPQNIAFSCNEGVQQLYKHTAGGRVRFKTDSPYIALKVFVPKIGIMNHMAVSGSSGFDLFTQDNGVFSFKGKITSQPIAKVTEFDGKIPLDGKENDCIISFPLYNEVNEVFVGIKQGSRLLCGEEYKIKKPIVFYGSSITQGGCASRPSNSYPAYISHRFNADFLNLGFSGNAKGEEALARYIASLEMSAFVLDYDYNAPDIAHLKKTHLPFYKTVRKANPDLPIIIISHPNHFEPDRHAVIKATYDFAVANGDNAVRFINGTDFFRSEFAYCTVDNCHPNDLGFYKMGNRICDEMTEYFY